MASGAVVSLANASRMRSRRPSTLLTVDRTELECLLVSEKELAIETSDVVSGRLYPDLSTSLVPLDADAQRIAAALKADP